MTNQENLALQDPNYSQFVQNQEIMDAIVREMKEIPELPSERPTDVNPLIKVEFAEDGGLLTYMDNIDYPYKGFPHYQFVEKIDVIKKISKNVQSGFFHALKNRNKIILFLLLFTLPVLRNLIWAFAYTFNTLVERFILKEKRYCPAVKEIYRACSVEQKGESKQIKELRIMIRNVECMILEFDNAYRYRIQDVGVEINKNLLRKDPIKEIIRVIDIMSFREKLQEQKDKWKLLKLFTKWYLRFDRKFLRMIVNILLEIDQEKIKLTLEDKAFCSRRKDYAFGFMNDESIENKYILEIAQLDDVYAKERVELKRKFEIQTDTLLKLHRQRMIEKAKSYSQEEVDVMNKELNEKHNKVVADYNAEIKRVNGIYIAEKTKLEDSFLTEEQRNIKQKNTAETIELNMLQEKELDNTIKEYKKNKEEIKQKFFPKRAEIKQ